VDSKIHYEPNHPSFNPLLSELQESLNRMNMSYYDLVYMNELPQNALISIEKFVEHVSQLITMKKIRYWGFLNWKIEAMETVFEICEKKRLPKPVALQVTYNLLQQERVSSIEDRLQKMNIQVVAAQSLASGHLTGTTTFSHVESWIGKPEPTTLNKVRKVCYPLLFFFFSSVVISWLFYYSFFRWQNKDLYLLVHSLWLGV
jgi:aryl-alcohol dehydrogenase-like predicted oxidoreductase